jgi:hypothetical protein
MAPSPALWPLYTELLRAYKYSVPHPFSPCTTPLAVVVSHRPSLAPPFPHFSIAPWPPAPNLPSLWVESRLACQGASLPHSERHGAHGWPSVRPSELVTRPSLLQEDHQHRETKPKRQPPISFEPNRTRLPQDRFPHHLARHWAPPRLPHRHHVVCCLRWKACAGLTCFSPYTIEWYGSAWLCHRPLPSRKKAMPRGLGPGPTQTKHACPQPKSWDISPELAQWPKKPFFRNIFHFQNSYLLNPKSKSFQSSPKTFLNWRSIYLNWFSFMYCTEMYLIALLYVAYRRANLWGGASRSCWRRSRPQWGQRQVSPTVLIILILYVCLM